MSNTDGILFTISTLLVLVFGAFGLVSIVMNANMDHEHPKSRTFYAAGFVALYTSWFIAIAYTAHRTEYFKWLSSFLR